MVSVIFGEARPRIARLGLALAVAVGVWLSLGSVSALAGEVHPLLTSFGSFTNPNGIAVDEASGDVYVADLGANAVYKFDASGKPVNFALGSNELSGSKTPAGSFSFPAEPDTPAAIAVDNACVQHSPPLTGKACEEFDPSAGDLYVLDEGHEVIDKFSATGTYLGQISGFSGKAYGVGVDGRGDVRVYLTGKRGQGGEPRIDVFDNTAVNGFMRDMPQAEDREFAPSRGFAVAPNGDAFALMASRGGVPCSCIEALGAFNEQFGRMDEGPDIAVAVDPVTRHVYVDNQSSVGEWDTGDMNGYIQKVGSFAAESTGARAASFGASQLSGSSGEGGIAVDGTSGEIYVSNPADDKVYVYGSAAPTVKVDPATNVTKTTATLRGAVNPRGSDVTGCRFEYEVSGYRGGTYELRAPVSTFGQSVPCEQSAAEIGGGTSPVAVSAAIAGLQAGNLYDFRLVVEDANGVSFSDGRLATTGPGFGVKSFQVSFLHEDGSVDTQAGSHPYEMTTNIAMNTTVLPDEPHSDSRYARQEDGTFKDVIVDLPPGLVGNPNATPKKCTLAQMDVTGENLGEANEEAAKLGVEPCPAESVIGELEVEFGGAKPVFETLREPIYNLVPPRGVAAQIGGHFIIPNVFINVGVLSGGDYPVQASALQAPVVEPVVATRMVVFGVVGKGASRKPFLTLPTACNGPLRSSIALDSYQEPGRYVRASSVTRNASGQPVSLSGCAKLQFPPSITVTPDTADASTSSGLTVGVHVPQKSALNPDGLAESSLRDTTVTLPQGVAINPSGSDGLEACTSDTSALSAGALGSPGDQIGYTGANEFNPEYEPGVKWSTFTPEMPNPLLPGSNFCPNGSKIGTVKISTPLLEHELEGAVYLATQNANPFGSLVAMYLVAEDPVSGTLIKLAGEVKLSDRGQIVTTFKNTPDLPFENLELHFFGGERAPLSTPSRCGTYTTEAVFTPWDGNGPVHTTSSFTIDHGPGGGPCPGASLPFNPSLTAGTTSIQAGGFSPFTMTMSRDDGNQNLQAISLKMPPGLSGLLTGVELCGEAQANAGTCGPNSQIGETIVSVGVGNAPFTVTGGKVYLTGPYKGAPFGLSIVNPAKAGPYDLGQVIVRAKIEVDPLTADLTVTSDNEGPYKIPTIIQGIPLQIKHVNVTINRPGFTFNPTDCNPLNITGAIHSTEGGIDTVNVPFQATNCARLSFKPSFQVSTSGKTSRLDGASLHVKLSYPKLPFGSQANIASVKVDLPKQLPSNLEALKHACIDTTFNANPAACPAQSRVGSAMATTPLIPVPLTGPAYFVSHGGAKFPELIVVLQGYGVTVDLHGETFINKAGITSSTFHTIPDVPVGTFELNLPERPKYAALAAPGGLCKITKTVLVKRKLLVRGKNGRKRHVTRKIRKRVAAGLVMPTAFTAQNGAVLHENTPIEVTGCGKAKKKAVKHKHKKKKGKKK